MYAENEKQLAKSVLSGDKRAFKTLVQQYERLVLHIVTPLIGLTEDREDICQDVFIKVYQGLGSFKHNSRLSTWIGNIAYNTSINFLRNKKNVFWDDVSTSGIEKEDSSKAEVSYNEYVAIEESITPEQEMVKKETGLLISEAINRLPEFQRITIILFHYEELSLREISEILNMPENTVKSYLLRGRKKLKELIDL